MNRHHICIFPYFRKYTTPQTVHENCFKRKNQCIIAQLYHSYRYFVPAMCFTPPKSVIRSIKSFPEQIMGLNIFCKSLKRPTKGTLTEKRWFLEYPLGYSSRVQIWYPLGYSGVPLVRELWSTLCMVLQSTPNGTSEFL